jgi:hypothetical protein
VIDRVEAHMLPQIGSQLIAVALDRNDRLLEGQGDRAARAVHPWSFAG